jgi:hypothetical protein
MDVLVVKDLWWPFGAHLLHTKWAYIYSIMNGYEFFYKYNHFPVFNGTIHHYFECIGISEDELINKNQIDFFPHTNPYLRGRFCPKEYNTVEDFHSDVLKKIYKPNHFVKEYLNKNVLLNKVKDTKYICVHIRLGDKVNGPDIQTVIIPLQKYFDKCKEVKDQTGINTIVVCSDTTDGLTEFISLDTNNEFEILFNDEYRSRNDWNDSIVTKVYRGFNDKEFLETEYLNCFVNFELLLHSDIIVANLDSGFCIVPVEIRNNKKDINVNTTSLWGIIH